MTSKSGGDRSPRAGQNRKKKTAKNRAKLKPRQVKLLDGLTKGKSVRAAALDAGYSPNTAQHPSELLDTVAMREALGRLLAPVEKIAQRINEGLDAMETKFFQFEGTVSDSRDVIAWSERRMYADLAAELKGMKPSQKIEHGGQVTNKIIVEMTDVAAQESA
jgi:phage terminase small subunit